MYLLIFESIGTAELIMIGLVALIIFGPRKLPEMMRTFGKALAEFKRSTNEFKESWEKEVDFESLDKDLGSENSTVKDKTIHRENPQSDLEISAPEIKEIKVADFDKITEEAETVPTANELSTNEPETQSDKTGQKSPENLNQKQNWF